jgi:hypothetical protein
MLKRSKTRERLVGRPSSAVSACLAAAVLAVVVARRVAATDAYLTIERSLPTYAGTPSTLFFVGAAALVALAAASSYLRGGVIPAVVLAAGPVVGWAVNHWSAPVSPHYAATFPVEMAVLYGGVFGVVGYLVGAGLRRVVPPARLVPVGE